MNAARLGGMRGVVFALAASLVLGTRAGAAFTVHLEGGAHYEAAGRCLDAIGGVPAAAGSILMRRRVPPAFRMDSQRVHGTIPLVFDYDPQTGACKLQLTQDSGSRVVFYGLCPSGSSPLASIREPQRGLELEPFVVSDAYGFGSMNGHLVFSPGGIAGNYTPLGLTAHFLYTYTWVPPSTAAGSPWSTLGKDGPSHVHCIYSGTLQLGNVPIF